MADIFNSAQMFEASTWLQSASSALLGLASGTRPNSIEERAMKWTAAFLGTMDWNQQVASVEGGLAVQATTARPVFYTVLLKIAPQFKELGLSSTKDIGTFLNTMRLALASGGIGVGAQSLVPQQVGLAASLLRELSAGLLLQVSNDSSQPSLLQL